MDASARLTVLTRIGFAARGLVYVVIGILLIRSGRPEDPSGALEYLAEGGGELFTMLIAAGFGAYGLWRLSDALFNIERHPSDATGLRERLGAGGSGVVHLLLAWQAVRLFRGDASGGEDSAAEASGAALSLLGPDELLPAAGLVLLAAGAFQLIKAAKCSYLRHLEPQIASRDWAKWIGRMGYGARGIVFLISGYFLLKAGLQQPSSEAGGIEGALAWLDRPWDVLVAAGLIAFGLYSLVEARFRILHDVPVREIADGSVRPTLH
jgi:hypothetical protein